MAIYELHLVRLGPDFHKSGPFVLPRPEVVLAAEEKAKAQEALTVRNRERELNKLRMRRVREAQRAVRAMAKDSSSAG